MFLKEQPKEQVRYYEKLLKAMGSLSNLFSESAEPYLVSRATENLFCKAFNAENLSRSDASADASKDRLGIGIKTFLHGNGKTFQKVAEFNGDHLMFSSLSPKEKVKKIAELRNERIETTKRIFGLDGLIYHCITRKAGKILIYEMPMSNINVDEIYNVKASSRGSTIQFSDPSGEYSFNITKSTLSQRFVMRDPVLSIPVRMLQDPFAEVEKLAEIGPIFAKEKPQPHVYLPLYSIKKGTKYVPSKSGLNQWNAGGRARDNNEIYIPIPSWIHKRFPNFFPERNVSFELTLPDRTIMTAKVCQDNSKALMSNPNAALGKWLLRDVLNLNEKELLQYEKLETIGLDSVVVYKIDKNTYDIDFTRIDSYEKFVTDNIEGGDNFSAEE